MLWAELVWGVITLLLMFDVIRIRRRWLALLSLDSISPADADEGYRLFTSPGVTVDAETLSRVHALRAQQGVEAVELIPGRCSLASAWSIGCHLDVDAMRADPLARGDSGAHAMLAPGHILDQMNVGPCTEDVANFVSIAGEVRRRCGGQVEFALVSNMEGIEPNPFFDAGVLQVRLGGAMGPVAGGIPFVWLLLGLGLLLAPVMGVAALIAHHIQQPLALRAAGPAVRWPWLQGCARIPTDARSWVRLLRGRDPSMERVDALRESYVAEMAQGTERFFEPVRTGCPVCDSQNLSRGFEVPDLHQGKPGRFRVVRCRECRHWFQNPRLSVAGLNFYYRDFYDGLAEESMDALFGSTVRVYGERIGMVLRHGAPSAWLDVGCGHGHMLAHARAQIPNIRLEGLDQGDVIETALARGWLDEAHRGLFTEHASALRDRYDVVSMSHYLEHTLEPEAELKAAHSVLKPNGHLLIEVPDPDSPFLAILGKWWFSWFQPQHIHLFNTINMAALLRKSGFEPVEWQTRGVNPPNDLGLAFTLMVNAVAPIPYAPWRKPQGRAARVVHGALRVLGVFFVASGFVLDHLISPVMGRLHHSSNFRVIARRVSG